MRSLHIILEISAFLDDLSRIIAHMSVFATELSLAEIKALEE
jgi:hypothetical protein